MSKIVRSIIYSNQADVTGFLATLDTGETIRVRRDGPNADRWDEAEEAWWNDWPADKRPSHPSATRMFEWEADRAEAAAYDRR